MFLFPGLVVAATNNADVVLNKHYTQVPEKIKNNPEVIQLLADKEKEVISIMFFGYHCQACSILDIPYDNWAKKNISLVSALQIPVTGHKFTERLAKVFYSAQFFDPSGKLHKKIFTAIHQENKDLWKEDALEKFFISQKISASELKQVLNSFQINSKVKKADELALAFGIDATPNIIIGGKNGMYLTNLARTESVEKLLQVMDLLVKKVK